MRKKTGRPKKGEGRKRPPLSYSELKMEEKAVREGTKLELSSMYGLLGVNTLYGKMGGFYND